MRRGRFKKNYRLIICLLMIAAMTLVAAPMPVGAQAGTANISLLPAVHTVNVGDQFDVTVQVDSPTQQIIALEAFLNFDATRLAVVQITPGVTLSTVLFNNFNNTTGQINYSAGKAGAPFPTGSFVLATITFEAIAATTPTTAVNFSTAAPRDTVIYNPASQIITGSLTGGTYTASAPGTIPPTVTTLAASGITQTTAVVNGNLTNLGTATTVSVSFEWGTTPAMGNTTSVQNRTMTGAFNVPLTGLTPGTTYYYRARAAGEGTSFGSQLNFTTPGASADVANLSLLPATNTVNAGDTLDVVIQIESGTQQVIVLDAYLNFDPAKLAVVQITPGSTLSTVVNEFDNATGRIDYSAAKLGAPFPAGSFEVATIRFQALAATTPTTAVSFSTAAPRATTVYNPASEIITGTLTGGTYTINMLDTTPPTVISTSPANGAINVPVNAPISITFSEPMNLAATQGAFSITPPVTGAFSWNGAGTVMTFTPSANMANSTSYSVTISTAATDRAIPANSLAAPYNFSFTTAAPTVVPPSVITNSPASITATSAVLLGNLTGKGTAATVDVNFEWGTVPGGPYPNATAVQSMTTTGSFNAALSGLTPKTTYYYRAKAVGDGTTFGSEMSFTTSAISPQVTTNAATSVTSNSAVLNGNLTIMGTASTVNASFQWGTVSGVYTNETTPQPLTATGAFNADLSGLLPETTYYYRARAVGDGTSFGAEMSFTTATEPDTTPPTVVSTSPLDGAVDVPINTAISVTFSEAMNQAVTQGAFSITPAVTGSFGWNGAGTVLTFTPLADLTNSTLYSVTISTAAEDLAGNNLAAQYNFSFTTAVPDQVAPSVTTNAATGVTINSATLNGDLTDLGTASTVNVSFQWGTASGTYTNETTPQPLTAIGAFTANLSFLTPNTTYYYRTKAVGDGTSFGAEMSFTTAAPAMDAPLYLNPAVVSFIPVGQTFNLEIRTSVDASQSVSGVAAYIDFDPAYLEIMDADPGEEGVQIANGSILTTIIQNNADNTTGTLDYAAGKLGGPFPQGDFLVATIQFRAKAVTLPDTAVTFSFSGIRHSMVEFGGTSISGTHANALINITLIPPIVITDAATNVTHNSATLNGDLVGLGTASTVNVSFQWGTDSGVYPNETTPQPLTATGAFNADLSGLLPETTYYYRARAVGDGTGFGAEMSFTTLAEPDATPPTVVSTSPLDGAVDVPVNTAVSVTFSEAMNQAVTQGAFSITPAVTGSFGWNGAGTVLTFTPLADLTNSTLYSVTISTAAEDLAGNNLAEQYNFSFTTVAPPLVAPSVTTDAATDVTHNSATLNGTLTDLGSAASVNLSFEYGLDTNYGSMISGLQASLSAPGSFSADLSGLIPNTTYHYRAVAVGDGTAVGADMTFTTLPPPMVAPSVTTQVATDVTHNSATLNGTLDNLGTASTVNVSFEWGTVSGVYPNETTPQPLTTTGAFTADLSGLLSETTYYYRAKAIGDGTSFGAEMSFTTQVESVTVDISVVLQGGDRPESGWVIPLTVKFFTPGANVLTDTPVYTFNLTTTKVGATAVAQCSGILPGSYDITVVSEHTLTNVKLNAFITAPGTSVSLGILREGDADNNGFVNIQDFGIFAFAYNTMAGPPPDMDYNPMADFDRNGVIDILDFGLIAINYEQMSPVEVP